MDWEVQYHINGVSSLEFRDPCHDLVRLQCFEGSHLHLTIFTKDSKDHIRLADASLDRNQALHLGRILTHWGGNWGACGRR